MKLFFNISAKIAGVFLAVYLIVTVIRDSGVDISAEFATCMPHLLALALILQGLAFTIGFYRWKLLLDVQGIRLRFIAIAQLSMIGVFFNLVIPGAVSGDVIKMVYICRHAAGRRTEAALTILLDRVLGLFGLLLVALVSVLLAIDYIRTAAVEIQIGAGIVGGGSIVGLAAFMVVFFRERFQQLPVVRAAISTGDRIIPQVLSQVLRRMVAGLDLYRGNTRVIGQAMLCSVAVHSVLAMAIFTLGQGFREHNVSLPKYFLATQVANTAGAIPVTPSGFGSRDLVMSTFLLDAGADRKKAGIIPAFFSIMLASWSVVGGIVFVTFRRRQDNDALPADGAAVG